MTEPTLGDLKRDPTTPVWLSGVLSRILDDNDQLTIDPVDLVNATEVLHAAASTYLAAINAANSTEGPPGPVSAAPVNSVG